MSDRLRRGARSALRRWMEWRSAPLGPAAFSRRALVVAAHPDDETLGCGGTIALKRRFQADVRVLVLTDGRGPNAHLMDGDTMAGLRHDEALAADGVLGVPAAEVTFGGLPGSFLHQHLPEAVEAVHGALVAFQPSQVFVPYAFDGHGDHEVAFTATLQALYRYGARIEVVEYYCWAWCSWPWVPAVVRPPWAPRPDSRRNPAVGARPDVHGVLPGRRLLTANARSDITSVLGLKETALAAHRTQVERLDGYPGWRIFDDVRGGEFLPLFFQQYEYFRRRVFARADP